MTAVTYKTIGVCYIRCENWDFDPLKQEKSTMFGGSVVEKKVLSLEEIQALLSTETLICSHDRMNLSDPGKPELKDRRSSIGESRKRKHAVFKMRNPGLFQNGDDGLCEVIFASPDRTAPILFKRGVLNPIVGKSSVRIWRRLRVCWTGRCQRGASLILSRSAIPPIAIMGKNSPVLHGGPRKHHRCLHGHNPFRKNIRNLHGSQAALPEPLLFWNFSLSPGTLLPFVTDPPQIASGADSRCSLFDTLSG